MKIHHAISLGIFALIVIAVEARTAPVGHANAENVLRIHAGDTVEIATDTDAKSPQFSWILTKDRQFQIAQRSKFFQTRFSQAGTYVLDVSIQDPVGGANEYRAFTIEVSEQTGGSPFTPDTNTQVRAILGTDKPVEKGVAYVDQEGGIIKLDPSQSQGSIASYDIDINDTVDSDGDGNPTNDKDTQGTLSQKMGSPIYLFVLPGTQKRSVTLRVRGAESTEENTASLEIAFSTPPTGALASSVGSYEGTSAGDTPIVITKNGGNVSFNVQLDPVATEGMELLTTWDFGDRSRSLLRNPTHRYRKAGSYIVTLTLQNISTGEVLWTGSDSVTIDETEVSDESSSSEGAVVTSSSASSESSSSNGNKTGGGSFGSILAVGFIVLLLLAFAIGVFLLVRWIKNKVGSKLHETLEKMEGSIIPKDPKAEVIEASTEPMKLKKDTEAGKTKIVDAEASKTDFRSLERGNVSPTAQSGPVPPWLAKTQTPAPSPSAPASPPSQRENVAPAGAAPATPDWLKKPAEKTIAPSQKPAPATAPKPPLAEPKAPSPEAGNGPVPDWLKPAAAKSSPSAPTPPAPVPAPKPVAPEASPFGTSQMPAEPKKQAQEPGVKKESEPPKPKKESTVQKTSGTAPLVEEKKDLPAAPLQPKPTPALEPTPPPQPPPVQKITKPIVATEPSPTTKAEQPSPLLQEELTSEKNQKEPAAVVKTEPKEEIPSASPKKKEPEPKAKPEVKPILPAETQPKKEKAKNDEDPPIAFIQADSLSK